MQPVADDEPGTGPAAGRAARRLSAEDLSILALENETVAGHTCKVIVLGGPLPVDDLRSAVRERLHRVPRLCLRLREIDGEPWWVPDPALDVSAHVAALDGTGGCDEAGLRTAVARLFEQRLDRSQPLWRIDVLPRLADGGSALIWRIHHALADGITAMHMGNALLWDGDPGAEASAAGAADGPAAHRRSAATADPAADHGPASLRAVAREAPQPWLRSPFSGHIDARRAVGFSTAGLQPPRQVAHAADGATVNDAVLAVVAGGLRRWLEAQHGHLGTVRVKVPVSLHNLPLVPGDDRSQPGNRDSFFCLDLPIGTPDPLERLAAVRGATRVRKQGHDAQHLDALMQGLARTPPLAQFAERVLAHSRSFALNVSNVPGPGQPVDVLGVPVRALYSLAEIREQHALRIAVVSLADTLNFGLVADPTLLSNVDRLADDLRAEAAELSSARPR